MTHTPFIANPSSAGASAASVASPRFERCMMVDIDLCFVGVACAAAKFFEARDAHPSVLWCAPADLVLADKILDVMRSTIVAIPDPDYAPDAWSVGTRRDRGFGSEGA